jgi:hypothetical protein
VTWVGGNGDWDVASNWSTGAVPGAVDDVAINVSGITITHASGASDSIRSLISQADINISAGSLSIASDSTINSTLELSGGALTGTGNVTVSGLFTWTGGTLGGTGSVTAQGGMVISGGVRLNGTLSNVGSATWASGDITAGDGSVFNNLAGASFTIQADNTYGPGVNNFTFNNQGTVTKTAGSGTTDFNTTFNNSGTVNVQSGSLFITGGGGTSSGVFSAAGHALEFSNANTLTASSRVTADQVSFVNTGGTPSTVVVAGSYSAASGTSVSGDSVQFSGSVSSIGALTVGGGTADFSPALGGPVSLTFSSLTLDGGLSGTDSFVVSGAFAWTGGILQGPQGSSLTAQAGMSISGNATLDGRTLTNVATAAWSGGTFPVTGGGVVNNLSGATFGSAGNSGTLALNGGTLTGAGIVNANVSNNGQVAPTAGGGLVIYGNYAQGFSGTLGIGLAGTAAGTSYSQLIVNGGIALSGSLAVSLSFLSAVGDQFTILHDGGPAAISGTFTGLTEGSVISVNGQGFQISYVGGTGHDVVLTHLNTPPTLANVAVTSPINEGSTATLTGNIVDADPLDTHTLVVNWGDGSPAQTFTFGAGALPFSLSHRYLDNPPGQPNGSFPIALQVTDSNGGQGTASTAIQVNNVAPTVGAITAPLAPVQVSTAISTSAAFTDPGVLDTHTAVWSWGDSTTSAGTVTEANGAGSVAGSHTYAADGVYTVTLTVTDNDGGVGTSVFQYVVVYNSRAGFTTGAGWFNSPAGAYAANPNLTGRANVGFNARYQSGATVPTGSTQFDFPAANLAFVSTSYDWLVITTNQAQFQGSGTINGAGNYGFLVTAQDNGGHGSDLLRLEIWDKNHNNAVVYDTQPGAATTAAPTTALGGGRIQVHTNAQLAAGGADPAGGSAAPLTPDELRPIVQEAIARWAGAGIDAGRLSALSQVTVGVAEFPGPWLGMAFPGAIWIDRDAAGYGWYIDPTPADDGEFPAEPGSPAYGKVDLLTVVEHELGHELGFGDNAGDGLMGQYLAPGTRRLPVLVDPVAVNAVAAAPALAVPAVAPGTVSARIADEVAGLLVLGVEARGQVDAVATILSEWPRIRDYPIGLVNITGTAGVSDHGTQTSPGARTITATVNLTTSDSPGGPNDPFAIAWEAGPYRRKP